MRRGWTRLWLNVSAVAVIAGSPYAQTSNLKRAARSNSRNSETTLGGLVPGRSTLRQAVGILGRPVSPASWRKCDGDEFGLDLDGKQQVQAVRMSRPLETKKNTSDCSGDAPADRLWKTGHGLRLGDSADRVLQLYGKPDSRIPSTKNGQELELFYYAFDWAGPDVPQIMAVLCTLGKNGQPGRVVEITLAASSL